MGSCNETPQPMAGTMRFYVFTRITDQSTAQQGFAMSWPTPLILASSSPRRKELLQGAGIEALTIKPSVDDSHYVCGTMPVKEWVTSLSILKARSVCNEYEGAHGSVLAADTVCVVDGIILGQPQNAEFAKNMIISMTNRSHEVYTGWCLRRVGDGGSVHGCETTIVRLGNIESDGLNAYIDSGLWRGKAGGYNLSERLTAGWPLTWEGDPTNVMGLPMERLRVELSRR